MFVRSKKVNGIFRNYMFKIINRLKTEQSGQTLVLALALLGVGSLLIAPMLYFVNTGLDAGVVIEDKTDELYDADAGVMDAIWKINNPGEAPGLPLDMAMSPLVYSIPILNSEIDEEIDVEITYINPDNGGTYRVRSWVGDTVVDNETMIDAVVTSIWLDYSGITNNVITTPNDYLTQGPTTLEPGEGEEHGPVGEYSGPWPTAYELAIWYERDVERDNPYLDDELLLTGNDIGFGPEFIDSDFYIHSNNNQNETLTLDGTLYITGQAEFGGPKDFTLDLNGNTIFVESDLTGGGASGTALWIAGNVTLTGSGCIIAVGDINFEPQMDSSPSDYILILSVEGQTWMHPNGDFYGTLAGNSEVLVQNGDAHWTDPDSVEGGINFPGSGGEMVWGIHTWEIN
jgi:hypothetical protein